MMLSIIRVERRPRRSSYHCDMPHEGVELDEHERDHLLREIERLNGQMEEAVLAALLQYLTKMSLTIPQLRVLMLLVTSEKGASGRDLAATFGVSMASMSTMLDRLASQGVAARTLDPTTTGSAECTPPPWASRSCAVCWWPAPSVPTSSPDSGSRICAPWNRGAARSASRSR